MNEYVTMKEIYNEASRVDKPMMFDTTALTQFPFLSEYFEHYQDFDRQFGKVLSNYRPIYNVDDISTTDSERQILVEQVWNEFRKDTTAELRRYNYNLKKLFSLIEKEYNPLENYNRHEESTDTGSDKTDETNNYDSVHTKSDFGKQKETQNFGENSETAVRGERNESVNYGEAVDTSVNKLSAYNVNDFSNDAQNTTTSSARSDTTTADSYTDTNTRAAHVDSYENDAHSDEQLTDARSDVKTSTNASTMKRISDISGNIGVTTSQQMFEAEWRIIKKCNPYDVLLFFVKNDLLLLFDEGIAPMNPPIFW